MKRCFQLALLASAALLLQSCKTGYNRPYIDPNYSGKARTCDSEPNNATATESAVLVYDLLLALSCDRASEGIMMGQVVGAGHQIDDNTSPLSYQNLFTGFYNTFSETPALLSVDYAMDASYNSTSLSRANERIKQHWNNGGVVMVSWRPLNPWTPESGILYSDSVQMAELVTSTNANWENSLRLVGNALKELQEAGVAVLWQPLPQMNTGGDTSPWWGLNATASDKDLYVKRWQDMHNYLTVEMELNNLLWVYSPSDGTELKGGVPDGGAPAVWAYPGDRYVDVIAPIVRDDDLALSQTDFTEILALNKPIGMAELGPQSAAQGSRYGMLDENDKEIVFRSSFLADRLIGSYIYLSFWASPYSLPATETHVASKLALRDIADPRDLLGREQILTLSDLSQRNWR